MSAPEIFSAIRKLLEALARDRPVVVILDDIHWAEPTLLDLIEYLVVTGTTVSVLLVCLARPELLELGSAWKLPRPHTRTLSIEPLSASDSSALPEAHERGCV